MALTSLKITWKDTEQYLQFMTEQFPTGLYVKVQTCNEKWIPVGEASETTDDREEEFFHRALRMESVARGTYVPQYSTNPEWNPGYSGSDDDQNENDHAFPGDMFE